jgi:hypothetical protein
MKPIRPNGGGGGYVTFVCDATVIFKPSFTNVELSVHLTLVKMTVIRTH